MSDHPLLFRWQGDGFEPANDFVQRQADKLYVVGEVYKLIEHHDRSSDSHRHFFASINEAWKNLPEDLMPEYPSPESLRKKMLVRCGYADERSIVCASSDDAQRVAAFVRPLDEYAVVTVSGSVVRVYTAQSQAMKVMGKKVFQESKQAVLDALDDLLQLERGSISKNAGRAA